MHHAAFILKIIKDQKSLNLTKMAQKKIHLKDTMIIFIFRGHQNNKIKHLLTKLRFESHTTKGFTKAAGMTELHDSFTSFIIFNLELLL